jgi:hypothetical protein
MTSFDGGEPLIPQCGAEGSAIARCGDGKKAGRRQTGAHCAGVARGLQCAEESAHAAVCRIGAIIAGAEIACGQPMCLPKPARPCSPRQIALRLPTAQSDRIGREGDMRNRIGLAGIALLTFVGLAQAAPRGGVVPRIAPQWQQDVAMTSCGRDGGYALDVLPGVGALVRVDDRLTAYSPRGDLRWQASLDCNDPLTVRWERAVLTPDGGAWALTWGPAYGEHTLYRLDPRGQVSASVALTFAAEIGGIMALSGDDAGVVVVHVSYDTIGWRRYDLASGTVEALDHQVDEIPYYRTRYETKALADGGLGLEFGDSICELAACPPPFLTHLVASLASDGELRWVVAGGAGIAHFDAQGEAWIVGFEVGVWVPQFLHSVTPAGEIGPDIPLMGVSGWIRGFYGPHAGRLLVHTSDLNRDYLWSIDAAGNLLASRELENGFFLVLDDAERDLVVFEYDGDRECALRIDALSLQETACYRLDEMAEPYTVLHGSRLLDDGTLYATFAAPGNGEDARIILARFDTPAPASDAASRRQRAQSGRALLGAPSLRPAVPRNAGRPVD